MMEKLPMNPRSKALALVLLAATTALPAAAQGLRVGPQLNLRPADNQPRAADYIVAIVNSEPVTNNEIRSRTQRFEQQLRQQGATVPPRAQLAREVLERLISEKAQIQLARELGIRVEDAIVDQAEQNVARQNQLDVAELRRRVVAEGLDLAQFRSELRNQILLQRLRDREVESRVKVSEQEIDQFLREQASEANAEMNLAHILIAVPENASEAQLAQLRAKAQQALQRARAGEDFAALVRELSDAPGAATTGGQLGMRPLDRQPPSFVEAVRSLPVGGVTDVLRSGAGFHVVKVLERRQGSMISEVTQTRARHILLRPTPQLSEAAARERLAEFKRRIDSGRADFAQLAREHSQDGSARNGGDLGWANPGLFVPEFEEVLNTLKPGQIAEPIVTRFGVHLVQVVERRQSKLAPREQREIARTLVREKKLDEAYVQWAQDVRGRAFVEYREPPQ
jgi:peptidyl-prolyl cis-trans isomerase SurA